MKAKPNDSDPAAPVSPDLESWPGADFPPARNTGIALKQILIAIDFSDCSLRVLDLARTLAQPLGANLTLLHVVEPPVYQQNYPGVTAPLDENHQNLVKLARERLAALCRKRVDNRLRIDNLVRIGRAHSEISDTASALSADLIVMGTHGYTGLKHVLLGSTAERVLRHAACPVLTVRLAAAQLVK